MPLMSPPRPILRITFYDRIQLEFYGYSADIKRYLYVRDRYDGRFYEQVYFMKGNNLLDVSEMEILSTFHHKFEN